MSPQINFDRSSVKLKDLMDTTLWPIEEHLKIHGEEESNKYNKCDYASYWGGDLKRRLKTHSGEKSNKCNKCDSLLVQAILGHI